MASTRTTTPERPAASDAPGAEAAPRLLTFAIGERRYGCRLEAVREIFVARPTTRLPAAPPHVLGLLNVRGTLLTVLDVGLWLADAGAACGSAEEPRNGADGRGRGGNGGDGVPGHPVSAPSAPVRAIPRFDEEERDESPDPASSGHVLVVEVEGRLGGCRVDGLGRAMAMPALDPPPAGNATAGGIVIGIGEADGELVAVLDLPRLVRQSLLFPGER